MRFMDAYIPPGALSPDAEHELVAKLTDLLIEHGRTAEAPRYRFI